MSLLTFSAVTVGYTAARSWSCLHHRGTVVIPSPAVQPSSLAISAHVTLASYLVRLQSMECHSLLQAVCARCYVQAHVPEVFLFTQNAKPRHSNKSHNPQRHCQALQRLYHMAGPVRHRLPPRDTVYPSTRRLVLGLSSFHLDT